MRRLAERTAGAARDAGAAVAVVAGDEEVRTWAYERGFAVVDEPDPAGLNAAASAGIAAAPGPWMVIHADLPAISSDDIGLALKWVANGGRLLAPSHDGGTSVVGATGASFAFSYGVGSFRRHLAAAPDARVLTRPGLALDLDHAEDLARLQSLSVI